jgi:hypothetical protein
MLLCVAHTAAAACPPAAIKTRMNHDLVWMISVNDPLELRRGA